MTRSSSASALRRRPARDHHASEYDEVRLALVRHPADLGCDGVVDGYRALLEPADDTFVDLPLNRLLDAWDDAAPAGAAQLWLGELRRRYLDLHLSDPPRCYPLRGSPPSPPPEALR